MDNATPSIAGLEAQHGCHFPVTPFSGHSPLRGSCILDSLLSGAAPDPPSFHVAEQIDPFWRQPDTVFEQAGSGESGNTLNDWMIRGAIAVTYIAFGVDKFGDGWTKFFDQVGFGPWFRYSTGVVEILGALLVLVPWTVEAGLALLVGTMAGAALIVTFIIHRPQDSVFSVALLIVLAVYWWHRRGSTN